MNNLIKKVNEFFRNIMLRWAAATPKLFNFIFWISNGIVVYEAKFDDLLHNVILFTIPFIHQGFTVQHLVVGAGIAISGISKYQVKHPDQVTAATAALKSTTP